MAVATRSVAKELLTYEQYIEGFDRYPPTTVPYEILDGVVYMVQTPNWRHQRIAGKIYRTFCQYEETSHRGMAGIAPFDVVIMRRPKLRTRQPDVFFISNERQMENKTVLMSGPLMVAPELVMEVLSSSDTERTIRGKVEDYASIGVLECWLVSPEAETVEIRRLTAEVIETVAIYSYSQTLTSVVFPDLTIAVADIFAD